MTRLTPILLLCLAACSDRPEVNPPTEPAAPIEAGANAEVPVSEVMPGVGAPSFVGRWASDPAWCAAPETRGSRGGTPITITATRFEGSENSCALAEVTERAGGYEARLACLSQGQANTERVRMDVTGDSLILTYRDREGEPVKLTKCTTLGETSAVAPSLPAMD